MSDHSNLQLRHDYISCIKLAQETDSKSEDAFLRTEAAQALDKLRQVCPHSETVCLQSEYEGSYLEDYSDHNPEYRICLMCGMQESAYQDKFSKLTTVPFARFEGKYPDQIKHPLSYLLLESKEIAEKEGYHYYGRVRMR